jgi:uncharacterized protein YndB with AHSA1/START domain
MEVSTTDRIEREIHLNAPRSRVWSAISNADEFGNWFGMVLDGNFEPGKSIKGRVTIKEYDHLTIEMVVDRVEPETLFSYRWHPYAVDVDKDYSSEPMTLVTFTLEDADGGTLLRTVESGFDALPPERVAEAYRMNSSGWNGQLNNIEKHVTTS